MLTDLDEAASKVRTPAAKAFVLEAISCHRAGAQRAAVISIWTAACVDIFEKIRELAASGDPESIQLESRMDRAIASNSITARLEFEREIVGIAETKLELLSSNESGQLNRLREDRGVCAHPTFSDDGSQFTPTPELARMHIVQTCEALLRHPPTQGKALIEILVQRV